MKAANTIKKASSEKKLKQLQKVGFQQEVEKLRKDYTNIKRFKQIKHEQRSKSLKAIPAVKLSKNSGNFLQPTKIISVTASKWAIFDYYSNKYIRGYRAHDPYNLSIFSKLLVFATINTLITKHKIDITRFQNIVTSSVLKLFPKKSNQNNSQNSNIVTLKADDILSLQDLLNLLLISESEEPELVLAVNIGAYLQKKRKKQYYSVYDADDALFKVHLKQFYAFVNNYCQTMKLQNIQYVEFDPKNKNQKNKCSAFDVAALSTECLKMPLFQKIMKNKDRQITIKYINEEGVMADRKERLENKTISNKFISYFNVCRNWDQKQFMDSHCSVFYEEDGLAPIVMVALGSYSPTDRQKDIQQIIQWYIKTYSKKSESKQQKQVQNNQYNLIQEKKLENKSQSRVLPRFKTELTEQLESILQKKINLSELPKKNSKLEPIAIKKKSKVRMMTEGL